jgi:shikimate kinase
MAKKQSTIYLSDDIYSYLIAYKDNNNLNNLSTAIERIILERIFSERGNLNSSVNTVKKKDEKKKDIPKTILDLKNSMRD